MHSPQCWAKLALNLKNITNFTDLWRATWACLVSSLKLSFYICEIEVIAGPGAGVVVSVA